MLLGDGLVLPIGAQPSDLKVTGARPVGAVIYVTGRASGPVVSMRVEATGPEVVSGQPSVTCRIFSSLLFGVLSLSPFVVVVSHSPPPGAGSTVRSRP